MLQQTTFHSVLILVNAALLFSVATRGDPIPLERRISWLPGITVSIPAKLDTVDVMAYGAHGDSSADDFGPFKAAIAALPGAN